MSDPVLIFLAIAVIIIAVAFLLSWMFRKTLRRDKQTQKAHEQRDDGLSAGIGIDEGDHY